MSNHLHEPIDPIFRIGYMQARELRLRRRISNILWGLFIVALVIFICTQGWFLP